MFKNILNFTLSAVLLVSFLFVQDVFAQASGYGFTQTAGTYTPISGGTVLWSGVFDDNFSTAVTMPSFTFSGTAYTTIYITANGYATLGSVSLGYTPISSTAVAPGVFAPFGRDLQNAASGVPEVRYETVGSEFVVQWQDVRRYSVTGEIFSFQLRLNSSDNSIKFVYGGTITPGANATYPQIGLRGATNTDFNNRSILTGGGSWINSVAGATNTATMFFNSSDPTTVPASGLTFTFTAPLILNPTGVTATPMSSSQIDVAFTPYAGNNVVMVFNTTGVFTTPSGAPPAPGTPFAGGTLLYNGLTSPYSHTSLTPATTYYYRLFSYGGGNYSVGVQTSATTFCLPVTSFPWTEGFESVTIPAIPNCWFKQNGDWVTTNNSNSTFDADARTGAQFLRESYGATNEFIWSPGFQLTAGTSYDFSFYWAGDTYDDWTGDVFYNTIQDSTGATQLGTSFVISTDLTTKNYQLEIYTFVPSVTGTYYFAIRVNASSVPWYLSFDDFRFEPTPACPMPTGITATGLTNVSANIGWNGAATVDIDYGTPGHPAGTGTVVSDVTTNPYTISGLSAYTTYDVYVRQKCGVGNYSAWAGPTSFTTQINPLSVPYTQSFDIATFPPGWFQSNSNWSVATTALAGGTPNEMMATWFSFVGQTRLIVGPINTSGMSSLKLAFKQLFDDYGAGITFKIQSSTDATTWTDESYSFVSGGGNVGPETVNTTISNNLGSITYIAWVLDGDHFQYDYYYIDDVAVTIPLPNDVGTFSIDVASNLVPGSVTPQATVKNFGTSTNTFNVQMNITGGYTSTKTVTSLAPGASQQVTFDSWNASLGQYTVKVFTQLGTDGDASNDTLYKNVGVYPGSWAGGSTFPDGTYLGTGVAANGILYSLGGNTNSGLGTECYKYDVAANTWSPIASLPAGRVVLGSATVGNFVYAVAGADMVSGTYINTIYKYDISANTWSTVAPLPTALGWVKAVGYNNKIYVAGGVAVGSIVVSSVYVYDVGTDTWATATSMPLARFGGAFSVTGNKLVYVGGADLTSIYNTVFVGTIDGGNPALITWTTMANPYPGIQKQVYSEYTGRLNELLKPNTSTKDHRSPEAAVYPPGTMYRFDGAPWGTDQIIVANGSPTVDWIPADPNPTYTYNPTSDTWTQQADVPYPVLGASLGTVNSGSVWKLIVASGYTGSVVSDSTQIYTVNLGGSSTFQLSINLLNGWNMVSVPGTNPDGMGVANWWPGRVGDVYKYNAGYQTVTTATPGVGYWMKNNGAQTYNTGDEWPAGGLQVVAHTPLTAAIGWNMIGGYEIAATASLVTTVPSGLQSGPIYKYSGGYSAAATIDPGFGYWIKLTGAGQIIIPESFAKDSKPVEYFPENWGRIVITDAAGVSYTLYAVNGQVDLSQYELPPAPPAGMYDFRYTSGRIAEDLSSSVKTIEMSGVVYPLTVRVEGMDIRLMDESGKKLNENLKDGESIEISESTIEKLMVSGELLPTVYSLEQNYPNPFNPSTMIEFSLPEMANVKLSIYNALGEKVAELVNTSLQAGKYQYNWNASGVATGMYIYELRTDNFVSVKKMLLLK
ncbi:MAG: T9SS type A sorting domain-containing protein [Ignavibacteriota bacterium]|nr:MAG: T9SS type A sorting domain-containing protein [Ignavibacteriota bacterium]